MSELDKLVPALGKAQSEFPTIGYDAVNPHFRNRYTTLAHLIAQTRPALAANSLAVSQLVEIHDGAGACCVVTVLMHASGQSIQSRCPVLTDKPGPQALGSGITYARRYGLAAILGVASEDDDDGEAAQAPRSQAPARKPTPAAVDGRKARDAAEAHEAGVAPPKFSPAAATVPVWFAEKITAGKHSGKSWAEMAAGSLGGERHRWADWAATKAEKASPETRKRAAYLLSLYTAREVGPPTPTGEVPF